MGKDKKHLFKKIFLVALCILLCAKLIFDFNGFWNLFKSIGSGFCWLFSYIIVGFAIAFVLNSFMRFLSEKVMGRWKKHPALKKGICIALSYVTFLGILSFIVITLLPHITDAVKSIASGLPGYAQKTLEIYRDTLDKLPTAVSDFIRNFLNNLPETVAKIISLTKITDAVVTTGNVLVNAAMGTIVSVYMLIEKENTLTAVHRITDGLFGEKAAAIYSAGNKINDIFSRYFTGKILQALIVIVLAFIVFSIARVPYAMLFAVVIGVLNMIPYLGPWLGAIPVCLITLMTKGFWPGVIAAICIAGIQCVDNFLICPHVVGRQMGISPLISLCGLSIGGKLFGIPGMIIGDVIAALVKVFFYDTYIANKLNRKKEEEPLN